MAELAGILYGRQATDPDSSTGTTFTEVSLEDRDGSATTLTPANGVEYLVLVYGMANNPDANTSWTELRALFGSTVYGRSRSCARFATFAADDESGGRPLATAFLITGNGTDELTVESAAENAGEDAFHFGVEVLAVPTAELDDFQSSETANSETAVATPTTDTAVGTDLSWSPDSDGDYIVITTMETFGDGTETNINEHRPRVEQGQSGSLSVFQAENADDNSSEFQSGQRQNSFRWARIMPSLLAANTYVLSAALDGDTGDTQSGQGNLSVRRIRHYAFRADSVTAAYRGVSTTGTSPSAVGTTTLGGQIDVEDAGEEILHTYLGNINAQVSSFVTFHFQRDVATGGGTQVGPNCMYSVADNGSGVADDHVCVAMQASESLTAADYTIDLQVQHHTAGTARVGRTRDNTADVDQEFLAIRWQTAVDTSPTPDIHVQRGQVDTTSAGTTVAPGTDFGSTTSAFVRLVNNRRMSAGPNGSTGNQDINEMSGGAQLTAVDEITLDAGSATTVRFDWESWEYVGAPGGDNEFIVRGHYQLTLTGETTTQAVAGVSNIDDCIPFITGIFSTGTADDADSGTAIAWMSSTGTLNISRGSASNNTVTIWVSVVEFTGSNWSLLHGREQNAADSGTITLVADADGLTGAAAGVTAWANSFISHQFRANNLNGIDDSIADTSAAYEPGTLTSEVDWAFHSNHVDSATGTGIGIHFVHVLEHADMVVTRYNDTQNLQNTMNVNVTSAALTSLERTGLEVSRSSSGSGTAYGRGWVNARLTSLINVELWVHRSGNTIQTRIQVVDFSGIETAAAEGLTLTPLAEAFQLPINAETVSLGALSTSPVRQLFQLSPNAETIVLGPTTLSVSAQVFEFSDNAEALLLGTVALDASENFQFQAGAEVIEAGAISVSGSESWRMSDGVLSVVLGSVSAAGNESFQFTSGGEVTATAAVTVSGSENYQFQVGVESIVLSAVALSTVEAFHFEDGVSTIGTPFVGTPSAQRFRCVEGEEVIALGALSQTLLPDQFQYDDDAPGQQLGVAFPAITTSELRFSLSDESVSLGAVDFTASAQRHRFVESNEAVQLTVITLTPTIDNFQYTNGVESVSTGFVAQALAQHVVFNDANEVVVQGQVLSSASPEVFQFDQLGSNVLAALTLTGVPAQLRCSVGDEVVSLGATVLAETAEAFQFVEGDETSSLGTAPILAAAEQFSFTEAVEAVVLGASSETVSGEELRWSLGLAVVENVGAIILTPDAEREVWTIGVELIALGTLTQTGQENFVFDSPVVSPTTGSVSLTVAAERQRWLQAAEALALDVVLGAGTQELRFAAAPGLVSLGGTALLSPAERLQWVAPDRTPDLGQAPPQTLTPVAVRGRFLLASPALEISTQLLGGASRLDWETRVASTGVGTATSTGNAQVRWLETAQSILLGEALSLAGAESVRWTAPMPGQGLILAVAAQRLEMLEGAQSVELGPLSEQVSAENLRWGLGATRLPGFFIVGPTSVDVDSEEEFLLCADIVEEFSIVVDTEGSFEVVIQELPSYTLDLDTEDNEGVDTDEG